MIAGNVYLDLHKHRVWVNTKLLSVAQNLTHEQLHQPFAIGQQTVWASLVHMFGAEYVWKEAFIGNDRGVAPGDVAGKLPGNQLGDRPITSVEELISLWSALNLTWESLLTQMPESDLKDYVYRVNSLTGARAGTRRSDVLLHLNLHAHYTTAQVINMFRQLGVKELPDPMFITLARITH